MKTLKSLKNIGTPLSRNEMRNIAGGIVNSGGGFFFPNTIIVSDAGIPCDTYSTKECSTDAQCTNKCNFGYSNYCGTNFCKRKDGTTGTQKQCNC